MVAPCKILAVDNEPSVALLLELVFPRPHYDLTYVNSGYAALAKLDAVNDSSYYDVIIVDQKMPNLSGLELVEAIKQRGITSSLIVISAHLSPGIRERFDRMGVAAMFAKPFDVDEVRSAIDRFPKASDALLSSPPIS